MLNSIFTILSDGAQLEQDTQSNVVSEQADDSATANWSQGEWQYLFC